VTEALAGFAREHGAVTLDGELVAIDRTGKPLRFQALQSRASSDARTALVVFDVLFAGKKDVRTLPWTARRELVEALVPKSAKALIRRGDSFKCGSAGAKRMLSAAATQGWEGVILKQMDATYRSGERSSLWRKVKLEHEQEFIIGGYTLPTEGADREHFGALLVGYYDTKGKLHYAGKVGTGYTRATLTTLGKKMKSLARATCPFVENPARREAHVWIKPELVAQIRYNEMTQDGLLRQPAFLGLRDDKKARDVRLEEETSTSQILDSLQCAS